MLTNTRSWTGSTRASSLRRAAATLLLAMTALLGAGTTWADTLVSNLAQTAGAGAGAGTSSMTNYNRTQSFTTGTASTGYTLSGVQIAFSTPPGATDTIGAVIADGRGSGASIIATLSAPTTWSPTSTFTAPANAKLNANTTYWLIIARSGSTSAQLTRTSSTTHQASNT